MLRDWREVSSFDQSTSFKASAFAGMPFVLHRKPFTVGNMEGSQRDIKRGGKRRREEREGRGTEERGKDIFCRKQSLPKGGA